MLNMWLYASTSAPAYMAIIAGKSSAWRQLGSVPEPSEPRENCAAAAERAAYVKRSGELMAAASGTTTTEKSSGRKHTCNHVLYAFCGSLRPMIGLVIDATSEPQYASLTPPVSG